MPLRVVLAMVFAAGLAACDSVSSPTLVPGTLPIESVDVVVLESFPYQLRAQVRGYLPGEYVLRVNGVERRFNL